MGLFLKDQTKQNVVTRKPRQDRSRYKVELILEATIRLLEAKGIEALTTNAIAAAAGVSIGTLYQYFQNKEAILEALADVEIAKMSEQVMTAMENPAFTDQHMRVAAVVRAVTASYDQRQTAHRLVMSYSLSRGSKRLAPLLEQVRDLLAKERDTGVFTAPLAPADAFVLTHAFTGVLRAMISLQADAHFEDKIADSLTRLVTKYLN